ncbi:MAG: cell division ATP-binding protein FtsE [Clostridia bacterium]|nr:cell division ATP-binding protein FtsE [Clostridia bacterium]
MITFDHVSKIYEDNNTVALQDVSFTVEKGEFVFLVGHSGAGKSSVIRMLLCEERPTSGTVTVNGFDIGSLPRKQIPALRRSLGVVFQDFRLLNNRTVYDNVAFAMNIIGAPSKVVRRRVPEVLSLVDLAHKARAYPSQLSGGEQQRVSMARALVNHPAILIADEPTGNLDIKRSDEIMGILEKINQNGTTVVMATHADQIVDAMKKRVITLDMGSIVRDEEKGGYNIGV